MLIFGNKYSASVKAWGPLVTTRVSIPALEGIIGGKDDSWALVDVGMSAGEIIDIRQCFADRSFIFALGNNLSKCSLTLQFVIFLGKCGDDGNSSFEAVKKGLDAYNKNRISNKTDKPTQVTVGGMSVNAWIHGIDINNVRAETGIASASIHCIMELPR